MKKLKPAERSAILLAVCRLEFLLNAPIDDTDAVQEKEAILRDLRIRLASEQPTATGKAN